MAGREMVLRTFVSSAAFGSLGWVAYLCKSPRKNERFTNLHLQLFFSWRTVLNPWILGFCPHDFQLFVLDCSIRWGVFMPVYAGPAGWHVGSREQASFAGCVQHHPWIPNPALRQEEKGRKERNKRASSSHLPSATYWFSFCIFFSPSP